MSRFKVSLAKESLVILVRLKSTICSLGFRFFLLMELDLIERLRLDLRTCEPVFDIDLLLSKKSVAPLAEKARLFKSLLAPLAEKARLSTRLFVLFHELFVRLKRSSSPSSSFSYYWLIEAGIPS